MKTEWKMQETIAMRTARMALILELQGLREQRVEGTNRAEYKVCVE